MDDGLRIARLGPPVIAVSMGDISDAVRLARCYDIVKAIVRVEQLNRQLVRIRSMLQLSWVTNEVPRSNGRITLVNVPSEQYEHEVLGALAEMLRNSVLGLLHDPESIAAILPVLRHARRKGHVNDLDWLLIGNLLRHFGGVDIAAEDVPETPT